MRDCHTIVVEGVVVVGDRANKSTRYKSVFKRLTSSQLSHSIPRNPYHCDVASATCNNTNTKFVSSIPKLIRFAGRPSGHESAAALQGEAFAFADQSHVSGWREPRSKVAAVELRQ